MALITTAGASDADSYASIAEADSYFTARGISDWTGTDTVKENALRRATTYLDNQYRSRWIGLRTNEDQALAWPRCQSIPVRTSISFTMALIDDDGFEIATDAVPTRIKRATMEAALLILGGTDMEPVLSRGGLVRAERVGPISVEYEAGASAIDRFTIIEGLLRGLVTSTPGASSGTVRLVRG